MPVRNLFLLMVSLLLAAVAAPSFALSSLAAEPKEELSWIYGSWSMVYDPDNSPPDSVQFYPGGTVALRIPGGHEVKGSYEQRGNQVLLIFVTPRKPVRVRLKISADRLRLTTKSGAYYLKD